VVEITSRRDRLGWWLVVAEYEDGIDEQKLDAPVGFLFAPRVLGKWRQALCKYLGLQCVPSKPVRDEE
jgi:hypothetical protein